MTTFIDKELKKYLRGELKEYEKTVGAMTADKKKELRKWLATGNSIHENPDLLYDENGYPLDFIAANRISEDMAWHPENYRTEFQVEEVHDCAEF